ncbi:hypothetical protein AAMO2058_000181000, partial [Amorphochlora amoebiformis]
AMDEYNPKLLSIRDEIHNYIKSWTERYLWQHDHGFSLHLYEPRLLILDSDDAQDEPLEKADKPPNIPHLWGRTQFGDNIQDEWFIVWLLTKITKRFPQTTAHIIDPDGQFLLIETAEVVPRALRPEDAINRMFIRGGEFIVLEADRAKDAPRLQSGVGLHWARTGESILKSRHLRRINKCIFARLSGFPTAILQDNSHQVNLLLPLRAAHLLRERPQLLPLAVDALIERDDEDCRAASEMDFFGTRPMVALRVRFTRFLYAQLKAQDFHPPPVYETLPVPRGIDDERPSGAKLGIKIAAGLEILHNQQRQIGAHRLRDQLKGLQNSSLSSQRLLQDISEGRGNVEELDRLLNTLDHDRRYGSFRQRLQSHGYFGDQADTKALSSLLSRERAARVAFLQHLFKTQNHSAIAHTNRSELSIRFPTYAHIVEGLEESGGPNASHFRDFYDLKRNDDDSWMRLDPEELPALRQARKQAQLAAKEALISPTLRRLNSNFRIDILRNQSASERIGDFLIHDKSGYKGIETPGERARLVTRRDGSSSWAYSDDDAFSMRDMMRALDNQVEKELNRSVVRFSASRSVSVSYSEDGGDRRRLKGPMEFPQDVESSMWSDMGESTGEGDIPRGAAREYMEAMDKELSTKATDRHLEVPPIPSADDETSRQYHLAKNLMHAYVEEQGGGGPASSFLGTIGLEDEFHTLPDTLEAARDTDERVPPRQ